MTVDTSPPREPAGHMPAQAGHAARPPSGSPSDPETILRDVPIGHRDWKRVLGAVLALHNHKHASKMKGVSYKTMLDRQRFLASFYDDLRHNTRFCNADPRELQQRHVRAAADLWRERGLSTATVHNYLSFLRTYCEWIGRPGLVRDVEFYYGENSPYLHRQRVAREDHSWLAKRVDVEAKLTEVYAHDRWVAMQLELCYRFGMRPKEARFFRPHVAVIPRELANPRDAEHFPGCERFLRVRYGTKGGRPRDVPIRTDEQRALIARAMESVAPGMYVGEPGRSAQQNLHRFYNVLRRFGITKAGLGVVAHGLRHQHANDDYAASSGAASPVRGGHCDRETDVVSRHAVAAILGHERLDITNCYLGSSRRRSNQSSASGDAPTPPANTGDET